MSEILKPLMTDETGQAIVEALTQQEMTQTRIAEINAAAVASKQEIGALTDSSKQSIETKTDEQVARIPEVTDLAADVGQLKGEIEALKKQNRFVFSGDIISANIDGETNLDIITKIGHTGVDLGVSNANLRITGANILNLPSVWGTEKTETKDGVTCTYNADGTVTLDGIQNHSGWTNLLNYTFLPSERIVLPAGTYYIPNEKLPYNCGLMLSISTLDGIWTGNKNTVFSIDAPFYISSVFVAIYGGASFENIHCPAALYAGVADLGDPAYRGNVYSVDFGMTVNSGSYNWTTGELTVAENEKYQFEPQKVVSLDGLNVIISSSGDEIEVSGYGKANESVSESYDVDEGQYAELVNRKQNQQTLTIGVLTDMHVDFAKDIYAVQLGYFNDMHTASDYINQDMLVNLGDILTIGYTTKTEPLMTLRKFAYYFNDRCRNIPIAVAKGNHDDNCYGINDGTQHVNSSVDAIITPLEWVNTCTRLSYPYAVFPDGKTDAAYFYIDNERAKIRTFVLNTEDFPYVVVEGVVQKNSYYDTAMSQDQVQFVADALRFADKTDPDEWAAVFLSHRPLDMTKEAGKRIGDSDALTAGVSALWKVVEAFRNRESKTIETTERGYSYSISVDYSSKTKNGEFIANIAGHTHIDNVSKAVGNTTDECYGYVFMTVSEFGPANIMIDRSARVIHVCKRYGTYGYRYSHAGLVNNIKGLASSGTSEWETVDADGCYKTQWTKL